MAEVFRGRGRRDGDAVASTPLRFCDPYVLESSTGAPLAARDIVVMERSRIAVVFDPVSGPSSVEFATFVESVAAALKRTGEVLQLRSSGGDMRAGPLSRGVRAAIRAFDPRVVLYVPSPRSLLSTLRTGFALRRTAGEAHQAMVILVPFPKSTSPKPTRFRKALYRRLYPDPILVLSYRSLLTLSRLSLSGDVLPFGVDVAAFRPLPPEARGAVRERYDIDREAFVFRVGPRLNGEGLRAARSLREIEGVEVVASAGRGGLASEAESIGVRLVPALANGEGYGLADCFVFAEREGEGAVEFPMSVVASLSSGVPVLSTSFGGLRDFLGEGEDLRYWSSTDELVEAARRLRADSPIRVRSVAEFSWDAIARRIVGRFDQGELRSRHETRP